MLFVLTAITTTIVIMTENGGPFLESPEKEFVKLRPANSVKLVFSYVVKRIKIKVSAKFSASRCFLFEHTKTIMSPEMRQKSFGTFEKRAQGTAENGALHCPAKHGNNKGGKITQFRQKSRQFWQIG